MVLVILGAQFLSVGLVAELIVAIVARERDVFDSRDDRRAVRRSDEEPLRAA